MKSNISRATILALAVATALAAPAARAELVSYTSFNDYAGGQDPYVGTLNSTITFGAGVSGRDAQSIAGTALNAVAPAGAGNGLGVNRGPDRGGGIITLAFDAAGFSNLVLSMAASSGPSPEDLAIYLQYSTDGTTFTSVTTIDPGSGNFALITPVSLGHGLDDAATGFLRFLFTNGAADASYTNLDNIQINGTRSAPAVPIPAAFWLLVSGGSAVAAFARRRKASPAGRIATGA